MTTYPTTYHRDGTVTYWDVYQQQWVREAAADISDAILSTLTVAERDRIERMRSTRYILVDGTGAHWPGVQRYRTTGSRGYATREEAEARAAAVMSAYAARHGAAGGPDLRVREAA